MNVSLKKIGAVILAAGLALSVIGCSEKTVDSVKAIQESGVFKVAIIDSGNQYTSLNGGTPVGTEAELIEGIASALGAAAEYQVLNRSEALEAVSAGTADVAIGCINQASVLAESYLCTTSYGKGFFYVVTEKGDYAQTAGSFDQSVVGVVSTLDEGTRGQLYASEGVTINEYGSSEAAAADIKDGRIRAFVCYEKGARELLSDSELQVQNLFEVEPEEYVIVAGKEDQSLVNGMNVLIQQFLEKE